MDNTNKDKKTKPTTSNVSNLGLLYDVFKDENEKEDSCKDGNVVTFSSMLNAFPVFLGELAKAFKKRYAEAEAETDDSKETREMPREYEYCKSVITYDEEGKSLVSTVAYHGVDDAVATGAWMNKAYADEFRKAIMINLGMEKLMKGYALGEDNVISKLSVEFYTKNDPKTDIGVNPWYWDKEMRTFYHVDPDGGAWYVRCLLGDNDVTICTDGDTIITDDISSNERDAFLNMLHYASENVECDKECHNDEEACDTEEKDDDLSYDGAENTDGAKLDEYDEDFDNRGDGRESDDESTLGELMSSLGYKVETSSVNDNADGSYSDGVKKLYKDIIYKESCNEIPALKVKDMLVLFNYMLDEKLYEYSLTDDKVVIAVSYEDMMANIDKPNYAEQPKQKTMPACLKSGGPSFRPTEWSRLDKDLFARAIRECHNFDEVLLVEMKDEDTRHVILCTFETM